jgi:hypothetical protein
MGSGPKKRCVLAKSITLQQAVIKRIAALQITMNKRFIVQNKQLNGLRN